MNGPKIYFTAPILGGIPITQTAASSFVVMLILCIAGIVLGHNLQKRPGRRQVLVEKVFPCSTAWSRTPWASTTLTGRPISARCSCPSLFGTLIGMTGILRSATADLSTTVTWALMTSVICWGCSIKQNGFLGWLKGFTEPVAVMTPMNIISEIAQPVSMAFRHFGNIAGGGVLTSLLYSALAACSAMVLGLVGKSFIAGAVVLVLGIILLVLGIKTQKMGKKIFGIVFAVTGLLGILSLTGVPYLEVGIPGILSLYFDVFSGGVQALVFSLLTMVYIGNACPPPEEV